MLYLTNSFSVNMLGNMGDFTHVRFRPISPEDVPESVVSVIGHVDTATIVSSILGRDIPANRQSITINDKDVVYLAQYIGPRLSEGATELPEGANISFIEVSIMKETCKGCPQPGDCGPCSTIGWNLGNPK